MFRGFFFSINSLGGFPLVFESVGLCQWAAVTKAS